VSAIISSGTFPRSRDDGPLIIEAAEAAVHPRFPDTNAVLTVELTTSKRSRRALRHRRSHLPGCRRKYLEIAQDDAARARI
jgi:hypothetical protein